MPSTYANSKTRRQVFEQTLSSENTMPDASNPGPGNYNLKGFDWDKGSSAAFRSGTKMAHQMTPSSSMANLDEDTHLVRTVTSAGAGVGVSNFGRYGVDVNRSGNQANGNQFGGAGSASNNYVQSFGTTAARDTCPRVHNDVVPHPSRANLYSERKIGPGSYDNMKSSFKVTKGKSLRAEPVGFNGTAERPCLKSEEGRVTLSAPGPGPIYNPEYLTMNFAVQKRAAGSRKIGVFGTTGPRFRRPNETEGEEVGSTTFNVGPGSYDHEARQVVVLKPKYTSAFKRDGVKGGSFGADKAPKGGFVVEGSGGRRGGDFDMMDDDTVELHKKKVRPAFGSSATRTDEGRNIDGMKFQSTPGPRYMVKVTDLAPQRKVLVHGGRRRDGNGLCTFGKDVRKFDTGATSGEAVGPGSYRIPSSISEHSFNVTLKSKGKKFVKKSEMRAMKVMETRRRKEVGEGIDGGMSLDGGLSLDGGMSLGTL